MNHKQKPIDMETSGYTVRSLDEITLGIANFAKEHFTNYETIEPDNVSFRESIGILNICIESVKIKLSKGNDRHLRLILGELNAFKMELNDII